MQVAKEHRLEGIQKRKEDRDEKIRKRLIK
jgi:hypothetical protein